MGATVVEITMRDDDATTKAVELLAPVGGTAREGKLVRVNVPGGAGASSMLEAVRILDGAHLDPAAMVLREPTLDDVFLQLTGHTTSDGDDEGGDE
jgi:hypothetical protein